MFALFAKRRPNKLLPTIQATAFLMELARKAERRSGFPDSMDFCLFHRASDPRRRARANHNHTRDELPVARSRAKVSTDASSSAYHPYILSFPHVKNWKKGRRASPRTKTRRRESFDRGDFRVLPSRYGKSPSPWTASCRGPRVDRSSWKTLKPTASSEQRLLCEKIWIWKGERRCVAPGT